MEIIISENELAASQRAAKVIARIVQEKPHAVIGLATGSTPLTTYRELIRLHQTEGLDFSHITTFNLDEYIGLPPDHKQSYRHFMDENLFRHINIQQENTHVPDGLSPNVPATCQAYETAITEAGGIDLQVLGIGGDGHIGFNEPTSSFSSRTRIKTLTQQTVSDNARFFEGNEEQVPRHCITMGLGTIMDARLNLLLAFGSGKSEAIAATIEGPVSSLTPASILQHHPRAKVFLDEEAASSLQLSDYYHWVYQGKPDWQKNA